MERILNLRKFMKDPVQFLDERVERYPGDKLQDVKLGHKRFVLVFDHQLALEVLDARSDVFIQNPTIFARIRPITGDAGLVQLNGARSTQGRARFTSMFAPENMRKMKQSILQNTEEAIKHLAIEAPVDMANVMAALVLRNAFQLFLGIDIKLNAHGMAAEFQELNALCGQRMIAALPAPLIIPTGRNRRIKFLRQALRGQITRALENSGSGSVTVASLFKDEDSLIDQCMTFLFAGHETTASSLAFTFLLLSENPECQRAIAMGDDGMALRAYKESLRLYPPAYMLAREAAVDCELGGLKIKKGAQLIIGVKQLHRDPALHQEAHLFKPDRFQNPVQAYLPFGAGPKACIGEALAYMEAMTIIKAFCRKFKLSRDSQKIECYPLVTLHPKPAQNIRMQVQNES